MPADTIEDLILIPVHWPKANWLISFLNSLALHEVPESARILLVASNGGDLAHFAQALSYHPLEKNLVLLDAEAWIESAFGSDALFQRLRENADESVINLKKFLGLHWALQNGVEYAICLDSDTLAITGTSRIHEVARENHEQALYLGAGIGGISNRDLLGRILVESAGLFAPDEQKKIANFTDDHTLYTWFGDMPVYRREDLQAFFEYMTATHGSLVAFFSALRWATFDHMLYVFHRVSHGNARIFNYRKELGIAAPPEFLTPLELFKIGTATGYDVGWMGARAAFDHPEAFRILPNLTLLSHFDRF
jgi:hypothetical protein